MSRLEVEILDRGVEVELGKPLETLVAALGPVGPVVDRQFVVRPVDVGFVPGPAPDRRLLVVGNHELRHPATELDHTSRATPSSMAATGSASGPRRCSSTRPAPRRTPSLRGSRRSSGPSLRAFGSRSPRTPSRPPGRPGAAPRRAARATPGTGRRTGCTGTRPGGSRDTPATEAEASRPCAAPAPGAPAPSPVPAAAPAMAAAADTAPPPAFRRPARPAAARRLPPLAPAAHSCRPCCGRSGLWPISPGGFGGVRTSAGEHLESWRSENLFWDTAFVLAPKISCEVRSTASRPRSNRCKCIRRASALNSLLSTNRAARAPALPRKVPSPACRALSPGPRLVTRCSPGTRAPRLRAGFGAGAPASPCNLPVPHRPERLPCALAPSGPGAPRP